MTKPTNQIPLLGIWNWAIQPVNMGSRSEQSGESRVRVRATWKLQNDGGQKALSKAGELVHRDNGAAARRAAQAGERASPGERWRQ